MKATADRPVFLDLLRIRLPVAAVMSIIHRLTGVFMVLGIAFLIFVLDLSVRDAAGFADVAQLFSSGPAALVLFPVLWALFHHLFAGIRFLLIDLDVGVDKPAFRRSAFAVLIAAPLAAAAVTVALP